MTDFWAAIDKQLDELRTAKTADDVVRILGRDRIPDPTIMDGAADGFFAGSGGDGTVSESLREAGWRVIWSEASYFYVAEAPDGSKITYIEGDIYKGDRRSN